MIEVVIKTPELANALMALAQALASAAQKQEPYTVQPPAQQAPPAPPVQPAAPVPPPVAPVQVTPPVQAAAPVPPPVAPVQVAAPAPVAPPPAAAPAYTLDQLKMAGTSLVDIGKQNDLLALLAQFQVPSINQLPSEQFGAFATALRGLGARI